MYRWYGDDGLQQRHWSATVAYHDHPSHRALHRVLDGGHVETGEIRLHAAVELLSPERRDDVLHVCVRRTA
ncbi:hypothetical protein [Isoptericola sp. BMS4]|uniref:hypothetical protein n=1 Tax=Isoptericola sp. BMS4 TaxID=2527875 RepID=UPI001422320A|nr:hypothetical protein [Isoptericola sp. BMS4]